MNGLLTATDKINRRAIVTKFRAELSAVFNDNFSQIANQSDNVPDQIRQLIESHIGASVPHDGSLSAVLVDSIAVIELVNRLAVQFGVPLDHKLAIDLIVNHVGHVAIFAAATHCLI